MKLNLNLQFKSLRSLNDACDYLKEEIGSNPDDYQVPSVCFAKVKQIPCLTLPLVQRLLLQSAIEFKTSMWLVACVNVYPSTSVSIVKMIPLNLPNFSIFKFPWFLPFFSAVFSFRPLPFPVFSLVVIYLSFLSFAVFSSSLFLLCLFPGLRPLSLFP